MLCADSMNTNCNIFEVWEEHKKLLYQYVYKRIKNEQDSKDLVQDVLLKCYQFCSKGKTVLHLKSWLFRVTQNAISDYFKKRNVNALYAYDNHYSENTDDSSFNEASTFIKALLKLLPEKYSLPLSLSDLEGVDQKTIAQQLGLSLTATKSRIQRSRKKLKERFLECCQIEFDETGEMIFFDVKPQCKAQLEEQNQYSSA